MSSFFKNSVYLSLFALSTFPLSYLLRLLLSRNLSLEEFGLFYALLSFFSLIQSFNDFGFSETQSYFIPRFLVQKRFDKIKATIKTQLLNQVCTTMLIALVLSVTAEWFVTTIFHSPHATQLFRIFIIYFLASDFLQNVTILFFSYQEAEIYGSIEPFRFVLITVSLLLLSLSFQLDIQLIAWIWAGVYAVLAVLYFAYFIYKHKNIFAAPEYPISAIYKEFFPFVVPTLLANNSSIIFSRGTETLLAFLKGVADVGLYNIAKPISNLALALTTPVANLLKPYIVEINELKDTTQIRRIILSILTGGTFLLLPFSVLLFFYAQESITFLFGSEYIAATFTLRLIAIEILLNILNSFVFGIVFGLGLQKNRAIIIYLSSFASLVLSLLLIPRWGAVGVAAASLGYASVALLGAVYIIKQKIDFAFPLAAYTKMLFLVLLLFASQLYFKQFTASQLSFQFLLFIPKAVLGLVLYYVLGIFWFKIIHPQTIQAMLVRAIPHTVSKFLLGKFGSV